VGLELLGAWFRSPSKLLGAAVGIRGYSELLEARATVRCAFELEASRFSCAFEF